MTDDSTACASCGAAGSGRFCSACGATRVASTCRECGRAAAGARPDRTPWLIAGAALVGLMGVLLATLTRSPATMLAEPMEVGGAPAAAPPDISNMSPRERFDRLYNRVMQAAQSGDEATVGRFTPMALMAYAQLDSLDADARYHAALLQVHTGDVAGPSALADTILALNPGHLFGYVLQGTVARWRRDDKALSGAYAGFLQHYDAELRAGRPEYAEHRTSIAEFHEQARRAQARRARAGNAGT